MESEVAVTCFTDLKGSTVLTETLGHDGFRKMREDHLRVGRLLSEHSNGKYIKNIGDAHMIQFSTLESAFRFSAHIQQYYLRHENFNTPPLEVRIGLYLGVVEPSNDDLFGSGVNQAARVEGHSEPGSIWVNVDLVQAICKVWGPCSFEKYFIRKGEFVLKGISNPPKQELYSVLWEKLIVDIPSFNLSYLVFNHLENASVVASNLSANDLATTASVIWPVVPRDGVNTIHRGQLEIIRLLALLGWKVQVLIADCGAKENLPKPYSEKFLQKIVDYASKRDIKDIKFTFMSDLFKPRCDGCDLLHKYFQRVISDLTIEDLLDINQKEYAKNVRETIKKSATLDFLRPALIIASVLHLSATIERKNIVIVGYDEKIQWERAHAIPESMPQFGVLFNPILKEKEGYQGRQTKNWPIYFSWKKIVDEMETYDLASWLMKMHLFIPEFPAKSVFVADQKFSPSDWEDSERFEKLVDKIQLAKTVFDRTLSI